MSDLRKFAGIAFVPLAVIAVCFLSLVGVIAWNTQRITHNAVDRWTGSDMVRWAEELQSRNPILDVPTVAHRPMQSGAAIVNRIGDIVEWSGDAKVMTGWTDKAGASLELLLADGDRRALRERMADLAINAPAQEPLPVAVRCKSGKNLPVLLSVSALDVGRYSAVMVTR